MKILYFSCHEVLEKAELSLLTELGHQVFSPGSYVEPDHKGDEGIRPGLKKCENYDALMEEWHTFGQPGKDNKENVSAEFFKKFDLCIVMHLSVPWISSNWAAIKTAGIPVVLRTIGQNITRNENDSLPFWKYGVKIVRYSPMERNIPGYVGETTLIRFYGDEEEFCGWTGERKEIMVLGQHLERRKEFCGYDFLQELTAPFPRRWYGAGTENLSYGAGKVSFDDLKKAMREHRVAGFFGTFPASLTISTIEYLQNGTPLVSVGPTLGNPTRFFPGHNLFELPLIIKNGENGFCSNDMSELHANIKELLSNDALAKTISANARKTGIELFGKQKIKQQWKDFLDSVA